MTRSNQPMDLLHSTLETPLGTLELFADQEAVREIRFPNDPRPVPETTKRNALLRSLERELKAYFRGRLTEFETPCEPLEGTEFQRDCWTLLRTIPFGATWTYGELAEAVGRPSAVRAVGAANGRNQLPIVVPCHRVIGSNGSLTGFGGGVESKRLLLELEGADCVAEPPSLFSAG